MVYYVQINQTDYVQFNVYQKYLTFYYNSYILKQQKSILLLYPIRCNSMTPSQHYIQLILIILT